MGYFAERNFAFYASHICLSLAFLMLPYIFTAISQRLEDSEKGRMKAELSSLKAQINPHFLFNTLNSIYALAIKKDDRTADSIVQLSELMRYIMSNSNSDKIELE